MAKDAMALFKNESNQALRAFFEVTKSIAFMTRYMVSYQHAVIMPFSVEPHKLEKFGQGEYKIKVVSPFDEDDEYSPKALNTFNLKYDPSNYTKEPPPKYHKAAKLSFDCFRLSIALLNAVEARIKASEMSCKPNLAKAVEHIGRDMIKSVKPYLSA